MDSVIEFYKFWQPDISVLFACLPELILSALAILALVFDVFVKKRGAKNAANGFINAALVALFIVTASGTNPLGMLFGDPLLFRAEVLGRIATPIFIAIALFSLGISRVVRSRESNGEISAPATTHLILIATAAASLLLKATNFVAFFVLLETLTVCLYALVGSNRGSAYSLEAGVKYLVAGGISGALTLFGIVLIYGAHALSGAAGINTIGGGNDILGYVETALFFASVQVSGQDSVLALVGAGMVIAGVMFKLGVFPMQFWIPDVYQGAPTHVTFFLATLSKATGFSLLCVLLFVFMGILETLIPVLTACALVSIVYANITALGQWNVKRLLGLSGVSHAGYLTLGLLAAVTVKDPLCTAFVVLYLVVYILTVIPIFTVMAHVRQTDDALQNFDDYAGLSKRNPLLAGGLAFGLGSLAGIPPTVGFIAKLGILYVLFCAEFYISIAVMLACVVAGIYYYFGWFRAAFSAEDKSDAETADLPVGACSRAVIIAFSVLMIISALAYWFIVQGMSS